MIESRVMAEVLRILNHNTAVSYVKGKQENK